MSTLSLSCDNFQGNITAGLLSMLETEQYANVTIAVEGNYLKAHQMVLSICSSYFDALLKDNPCKHPIIYIKGVRHSIMKHLLRFMYEGQVEIDEEDFQTFIDTAHDLQIRCLTECKRPQHNNEFNNNNNNEAMLVSMDNPSPALIKPVVVELPDAPVAHEDLFLPIKSEMLKKRTYEDAVTIDEVPDVKPVILPRPKRQCGKPNKDILCKMLTKSSKPIESNENEEDDDDEGSSSGEELPIFSQDDPEYTVDGELLVPPPDDLTLQEYNGKPITVTFLQTRKNLQVMVNKFRYSRDNSNTSKTHTSWRCTMRGKRKVCLAYVKLTNDNSIIIRNSHTHPVIKNRMVAKVVGRQEYFFK